MPNPPNDSAQYLANLFAAGQDLMQKFAASIPSASGQAFTDPAAAFMATSKSFAAESSSLTTGGFCTMDLSTV